MLIKALVCAHMGNDKIEECKQILDEVDEIIHKNKKLIDLTIDILIQIREIDKIPIYVERTL